MTTRIQSGMTEDLEALITAHGLEATGLTDVLLTLRRVADDFFLDFADGEFKASGWTEKTKVMEPVDNAEAPGMYRWVWNTVGQDEGQYVGGVTCASGHNVPQVLELHVGQWPNHIDADISSRQSESSASLRALADIAAHGVTQASIAALPVPPTAAAITTAILDRALAGHLIPGTVGHALLVSLSVPQQNVVNDGGEGLAEIVYNDDGFMTSSRRRIFATATAADAATPGALNGADGEISLIMYTGVPHGTYPKLPGVYRSVNE